MGRVVQFKAASKTSRVDTLGKSGKLIEFPRRPVAARYAWQAMDYELGQVLAAGMDAELIVDGAGCWVLVKAKDSLIYVFLIDSADVLFTVLPADEFEEIRPELECWASEVFSWLWRDA